jgi:hypothetical protein
MRIFRPILRPDEYDFEFNEGLKLLTEGYDELKKRGFDIESPSRNWPSFVNPTPHYKFHRGAQHMEVLDNSFMAVPWPNYKARIFWVSCIVFYLLWFHPHSDITRIAAMALTIIVGLVGLFLV